MVGEPGTHGYSIRILEAVGTAGAGAGTIGVGTIGDGTGAGEIHSGSVGTGDGTMVFTTLGVLTIRFTTVCTGEDSIAGVLNDWPGGLSEWLANMERLTICRRQWDQALIRFIQGAAAKIGKSLTDCYFQMEQDKKLKLADLEELFLSFNMTPCLPFYYA